ncbi:MAG TPA: hypothetical protein PLX06_02375 [Fimbriimonadaceae bacterium]|nr:hypothetical protein [Fimbriimonadaceae bacterium]
MKLAVLASVVLAVTVLGCAKEPEKNKMGFAPKKSEPLKAGLLSAGNELKDVLIRQIAAQNREDIEGYLLTIDPSSPVYVPTKTGAKELFEKYDLEVTLDSMEVVDVNETEGKIRMVITTVKKSGPEFMDNRVTALNTMKKVDGKWLTYSTELEKVEKVP